MKYSTGCFNSKSNEKILKIDDISKIPLFIPLIANLNLELLTHL